MAIPGWTKWERECLHSYEGKIVNVKDRVRGIAKQIHTGMFLWGEGGTSKSYSVLQELRELKAKHIVHNSRITGKGLFDVLMAAPTDIHVIEDAETMFDDKKSVGVLRSALWNQDNRKPMERNVSWTVNRNNSRFIFTGGIIIISNANLTDRSSDLRALKTRASMVHLEISNDEIKALMKKICLDGFTFGDDFLSPDECWEVATFIMQHFERLNRNLDLRLLINGFKDFLQRKTGDCVSSWQNLLESRMMERAIDGYVSREDESAEKTRIALEIRAMKLSTEDSVAEWKKQTGLEQAAYYRALRRADRRGR